MNISKKKIVMLIVICIALTGCKKFLEIDPKGKVLAKKLEHYNGLFNNTLLNGFQNLKMTSTTNATTGELGYSFSILGEVEAPFYMSDDMMANPSTFQNYSQIEQKSYKWADDIYLPDDNAAEWGTMYIHNYVYNVIVNGVMNAEDGTEAEKKALQAEARVARAYMHFWVAQLFAKPFNENTAANDPGIPIVTEASTETAGYNRASVKATYDFIVNEINVAIPYLSPTTVSRGRISQLAAYSILGEVYFNMGKYAEALTPLKKAFDLVNTSKVPISLYNYNTKVNDWYISFFPNLGLTNFPNPFDSYETIFVEQTAAPVYSAFSSLAVLTPETYSLFGPDDQRKKAFSNKGLFSSLQLPGYQRSGPLTVNLGPTLPNLYLMKAECEARGGQLSDAENDLETLRKNRMPDASAQVQYSGQQELVKLILRERILEFAATGRRWFDMRRLFDDVNYNNIHGSRTVDSKVYTLNKNRLTLKIPPMILNYNPSMPNNP
nr:RagB/SusD family nutrient uptake outer membrane protein [Pedobacter sp. ASV19]